jgi:parvulin-like peptidyl-prolyl isomerase
MTVIAKISDQEITADEFIKSLKFNNKFDETFEPYLMDKVAAHAAKQQGISVSVAEVQQRVDDIRRVLGLHRAKDALEFLDSLSLSVDDFEQYVTDLVYKDKAFNAVCTDQAVEEYFKLHSPRFDGIELSQILLESEGKAKEMMALLADDPDSFAAMAKDHSLDYETRDNGGVAGKVLRGTLEDEIDAKVFNASKGEVVGPFMIGDGLLYEIFRVTDIYPAKLDDSTRVEVQKLLFEEWLEGVTQEFKVEIL